MTATDTAAPDDLDALLTQAEALSGGRVRMHAVPGLAQLHLALGRTAGPPVAPAELGLDLPATPNTWRAGPPDAHWLAPGEWLLVGPSGTQQALEQAIRSRPADDGDWSAVVDVSDQRAVLEVAGTGARELLAAGCPLDLHPRSFGPLRCAQSQLGRAGVLVAQLDDLPTYRIFVRRSFASHLAAWLLDGVAGLDAT